MSKEDNLPVSVIVPVYNCAPYIGKCIDSLISQTYKNIEIIVIDDGSTDRSSTLLSEFNGKYSQIKLISQPNQGVCRARNNGLDQASGEYITFVDGDDYVDPDYIETLVRAAEGRGSDLVICGYKIEDAANGRYKEVSPSSYTAGTDEMWAYRIMATWGRLYRRDFWDKNNFRFTTEEKVRAEDLPIALCANYLGKNITVIPDTGYHYIQHEGSAMTGFQGLKNFTFPKQAFGQVSEALKSSSGRNGRDFLVYGILKTFAQFSLNLSKGADKKTKKELDEYFIKFIKDNAPDFNECRKRVNKGNLPVYIRAAVWIFCIKCR